MKSASKWIVLALALTFLFALAVPAMAADNASISRLQSLGIVQGDPNGDLRLDDTITRAEFAKIAVMAAGMEDAASLLASAPSEFSDVKAGAWYTGWINVAAAQGLVKGDGNGTYRPNDDITGAEVATVLLRILGYNDNLPGSWPTDYIVKAVSLGVTDGASFSANVPAVRGSVFTMADNTLDTKKVTYSKDTEEFTEGASTLVEKSFESAYKKGVLQYVSLDNDDNIIATIGGTDYKVLSDATVVGADDIFGAENSYVKFVAKAKTSGKDEISYLTTTEDRTVVTGKIKEIDVANNKIKIGSTKYEYDSAFGLYIDNDAKQDYDGTDAGGLADKYTEAELFGGGGAVAVGDVATLIYKGSDLVLAKFDSYNSSVVDEVRIKSDETKIVSKGAGSSTINTKDDSYLVIKDGKAASLDDIEENDVYQVFANKRGVDKLIVVKSEKVEGAIDKAATDYSNATIDGTKYTVDGWYNSKDSALSASDKKALIGKDVTALIDFDGDAIRIIGDADADATEFFAVLTKGVVKVTGATGDAYYINIMKADGTKEALEITKDTKYTLYDTWDDSTSGFELVDGDNDGNQNDNADNQAVVPAKIVSGTELAAGEIVWLTLDNDGKVSKVVNKAVLKDTSVSGAVTTDVNSDDDRINISGTWYGIDDSTVVIKADAVADKFGAISWKDIEDSGTIGIYAKTKDAWVKQLVVYDITNLSTKKSVAMVLDKFMTNDGINLDLDVAGSSESYVLKSSVENDVDAAKGNLVEFTLSSGDINSIDLVSAGTPGNGYTVTSGVYVEDYSVDNLTLKVDNNANLSGTETNYFVASDVCVYDVSGTSPKVVELADLAKEDKVELYVKKNEVKFILIK